MTNKKSAYADLSLDECLELLVLRFCACGCGLSWRCLPASKSNYARASCNPGHDQNALNASWGSAMSTHRQPVKKNKKAMTIKQPKRKVLH